MGIYYVSGVPFGDELYHYRTKGSKNGVSTTPGYKAIGQLVDATRDTVNRVRYLRDRAPELVKAVTTKDSKNHFIVKPETISDLYTGEHHKRAAENDRRHITEQFRKTAKDLEEESYNGGSKQMGELVRKYGDATARIYGSERDWSMPGIKNLREDANWNLQQYENAPRQKINRAVDSGKQWIEQTVKSTGKGVSKAYDDASKWVDQASKDVGEAATKAYNDASKWAGNAVKDVGNTASKAGKAIESGAKSAVNAGKKAAKDIGDWGGNQIKKGKKFLKSIFG